jgi:hypothetical protein
MKSPALASPARARSRISATLRRRNCRALTGRGARPAGGAGAGGGGVHAARANMRNILLDLATAESFLGDGPSHFPRKR